MSERLRKWFAKTVFTLLGLVVIAYSVKLSYDVMTILFPNDPVLKFMAIAVFDGGVIGWLLSYMNVAKGTVQRGISIMMTVGDFIGVAAMVIAGIYLGGQTLANVPQWVGNLVVIATIIATVANAGAYYYYHGNDPRVKEETQTQELEDTLNEEALEQAKRQIETRAQQLGAIMANRVTARMKYRLRLPMTEQEVSEWKNEAIDAESYDVPALPYQKDPTFWEYLRNFLSGKPSEKSSDTTQSVNSTDSRTEEQDTTKPLPPLNPDETK